MVQQIEERHKMRIEGNVRLKDMNIEWSNETTYLGGKMDKSQSGSQSKTVPHDKQDIEASISEQSDAHQVGSSTAPEETSSRTQ